MKPPLLYLCHRIPYPPNKGDKIRSYHLLKYLLEHYRVYLGAFIDNKEDREYVGQLQEWCEECCFIDLDPAKAKLLSLRGLIQGAPLTIPYYASPTLKKWVDRVCLAHNIQHSLVFSAAMAQYVMGAAFEGMRRVIDFVDIDSDKWRQYAPSKPWPLSWIYRREARRLLGYEREVASLFDASLFVSEAEAGLFRKLAGPEAGCITHFNNGVDSAYFSPGREYENPFQAGMRALVFTGAMDYWPNIDAVTWFADEIFPQILKQYPDVCFYIVGGGATDAVHKLGDRPGVVVTGRVPDVRPYLAHSVAVVVPMRIARGIQNKVLEAMAMECPVVVSPQGYEGITARTGQELVIAEAVDDWISAVSRTLSVDDHKAMGQAARQRVVQDYNWQGSLARLEQYL